MRPGKSVQSVINRKLVDSGRRSSRGAHSITRRPIHAAPRALETVLIHMYDSYLFAWPRDWGAGLRRIYINRWLLVYESAHTRDSGLSLHQDEFIDLLITSTL